MKLQNIEQSLRKQFLSSFRTTLFALEENALHRPSKLASSSMEPSPHRSELPTGSPHRHRQKEEDPHLHTKDTTRVKFE
jgi:hypothetical protein